MGREFSFYSSSDCGQELWAVICAELHFKEAIPCGTLTFIKPVTLTNGFDLIVCADAITWTRTSECVGTSS